MGFWHFFRTSSVTADIRTPSGSSLAIAIPLSNYLIQNRYPDHTGLSRDFPIRPEAFTHQMLQRGVRAGMRVVEIEQRGIGQDQRPARAYRASGEGRLGGERAWAVIRDGEAAG